METLPSPIVKIEDQLLDQMGVKLFIKREDLNHPIISGNKWRKLKYNLLEAQKQGFDTLLTFGGAYSNHIHAVAGAGQVQGFNTIGVIRGEEHNPLNQTLAYAKQCGMKLHYLDRETYRQKHLPQVLDALKEQFGKFYLIPEGGTNALAITGCEEIIDEIEILYDVVCCPVGTGGTISGLISALAGQRSVMGFSVLKGDFLQKEVANLLTGLGKRHSNWSINSDYHFGGYAKVKQPLINFILEFEKKHGIPLEPIYTGKMMFGLFDMISKGGFKPETTIVAIHTGGLQGNDGFEFRNSL